MAVDPTGGGGSTASAADLSNELDPVPMPEPRRTAPSRPPGPRPPRRRAAPPRNASRRALVVGAEPPNLLRIIRGLETACGPPREKPRPHVTGGRPPLMST